MNPFVLAHPLLFTLILMGVILFHAFAFYCIVVLAKLFFSQWR